MKPRETYRITAVRLVEFHNLGTTTIEIPDGGHRFLLGDNGSGNTTILDAIHLVLTAGREMEFNSAARVAGAKDSGGRTIQGIVLRYNAVTGRPMRETGISYAAVELRSDSGRVCSLAVGLSADGMDVAFERWGGIASVSVGELPLSVEEGGKMRVATQSEFKRAITSLAGGRHYAHINDYADAVGSRLFGGEAKYADVCKLLRTGKAYREIAARAANYDDLFRKLLEDPDIDTFAPLLKGLRELEESRDRLNYIGDRANYLNDLRLESERLGRLRLKGSLVSWSEAERRRAQALREATEIASAEASGKERLAALESEWSALKDEVARGRERLAALRQKDSSGLIGREKSAAQRLAEAERKSQDAERTLSEERRGRSAAEKSERDVRAKCAEALRRHADEIVTAGKSADFPVASVSDPLYGGDAETVIERGAFAAFEKGVSVERESRSGAAFAARTAADASRSEADARRRELAEIRSRGESVPAVEGFAEVKSAIRAQMLSARPVYELLESASGCDARHLAMVERLAGDDFLATWLVKADEADHVRRIAWRDGSKMSVAVREELSDVSVNDLAPWLGAFVSFEDSDVDAVKLLARHLAGRTS